MHTYINNLYSTLDKQYKKARKYFHHHLTYTEKILFSHLHNIPKNTIQRGVSYVPMMPDRIAMQDATAQMAMLQFINSGIQKTSIPTSIHCDHLITANIGNKHDLKQANIVNKEIYDFLQSVSIKYNLKFWPPGSGIIHQTILENYAFPGGMMIGTDSHTTNAGGLSMIAIGIGGSDAVDVMIGEPLILKWPKIMGIKLTGKLHAWSSPKDVILYLMKTLTVKGGTGYILEFFGNGCSTISATGKATITNMGAEHGATTSLFPYDDHIYKYLKANNRSNIAQLSKTYAHYLKADDEVYQNPEKFYDKIIHINLDHITQYIAGPYSPDNITSIDNMKEKIKTTLFPNKPSAALIGSCTNSSYHDIGKVAYLANFAIQHNMKLKIPLFITPGSQTTLITTTKDKLLDPLIKLGATILANACGPCIGQWKRNTINTSKHITYNSIISSYNRNFPGRNDGNINTLSFITTPEIVMAIALSGDITFNPNTDEIKLDNGKFIKLPIPKAETLPKNIFHSENNKDNTNIKTSKNIQIIIDKKSDRLSLLQPFPAPEQKQFYNMHILLKSEGKCTTDHISPAGEWLKFRGHLENISNNTYINAKNTFTKKIGYGILKNNKHNNIYKTLPEIAKSWKKQNISWIVIGDDNFGEGSSREHAAMQPRYLGCKTIISRSFARIHETNLKKHGILPLIFDTYNDYNKFNAIDKVDINNIHDIKPNTQVLITIKHLNNKKEYIKCHHTLSDIQIKWFQAGSILNYFHNKNKTK